MTYKDFIAAGAQADVLRILRICMDWNIRDAAAALGISVSYISEMNSPLPCGAVAPMEVVSRGKSTRSKFGS